MISRKGFAYKLDYEGWDYMLTEINPEELEDPALAEALQDAQDAFKALQKLAPSIEEFSNEDDEEDSDFIDSEDVLEVAELDFSLE